MTDVFNFVSFLDYFFLAAVALWGLFCVVVVLSRVARKRFKNEDAQNAFLDQLEPSLRAGDFAAVEKACEGNEKALPMMMHLASLNRGLGYQKVRQLVTDRFQRDVLADFDNRMAWIVTVIKTAPMLGLFGTVLGMMGAFGKLASSDNVKPDELAGDIRVALETTAIGLLIAIPLVMAMAMITNRIREMQDLVGAGLNRFLEAFKVGLTRETGTDRKSA
jgi:biopolymer transport protein ExbB